MLLHSNKAVIVTPRAWDDSGGTSPPQERSPAVVLAVESSCIDIAQFPGIYCYESRIIMLGNDGKVGGYECKTLELVLYRRNLHEGSWTTCICFADAFSIASGGADGSVLISSAWGVETLCRMNSHEGSVVAVDVWCNHLVSMDDKNQVRVFSIPQQEDAKPTCLAEFVLHEHPHVVKLVKTDDMLRVFLTFKDSCQVQLVSVQNPHVVQTVNMAGEHTYGTYTIEGVTFNPTRTSYAVGVKYTGGGGLEPSLDITTGTLRDTPTRKSFTIHGDFSKPRMAWSLINRGVYVTDDPGNVYHVSLDTCTATILARRKGMLNVLYVNLCDNYEHVTIGGTDGKVYLWKLTE